MMPFQPPMAQPGVGLPSPQPRPMMGAPMPGGAPPGMAPPMGPAPQQNPQMMRQMALAQMMRGPGPQRPMY